jgi:4-carboxymuconolactone decarboxylase
MSHRPLPLPPGVWTLPIEANIVPAQRESLSLLSRGVLWLTRRRTGETTDFTVFATLARLGRLFPAHTVFLSQLLGKTRLSAAEKELIVLREAWRLGCAYEFSHHHQMAMKLGVPAEQIQAATTETPVDFTPRLTALLAATDELVRDHQLSASGLIALRDFCSDDEVLELCMFVGHYVMIAMIINTAGVQPEPNFAVTLPT